MRKRTKLRVQNNYGIGIIYYIYLFKTVFLTYGKFTGRVKL